MKNVKPKVNLDKDEKSAIHAVKALVFEMYASSGNFQIAFKEAEEARGLNSDNTEWINIWLNIKGLMNRDYNNFARYNDEELTAAEILYNSSGNYWHLLKAGSVFVSAFKTTDDIKKRNKYFEIASRSIL